MSSHGGHPDHNFPFGYNPTTINGIGLPPFRTPGPPIGQPLLNQNEQQHFSNFLSDFDTTAFHSQDEHHFDDIPEQVPFDGDWNIPHYVGAETSLGTRPHIDPHHLQSNAPLGQFDASLHGIPQMSNQPFDSTVHTPHPLYANNTFDGLFSHHPQPPATMSSGFSETWQHPSSDNYPPVQGPSRPQVRFGTDNRFQPNGFAAPGPPIEHDMSQLQNYSWIEAPSTATNTAPNSAHNTNPSSPVLSRKRKHNDFKPQDPPNGLRKLKNSSTPQNVGLPQTAGRRPVVQEQRPRTPISQTSPIAAHTQSAKQSAEVESEEEGEQEEPSSLAGPWPASKPRPPRKAPKPPKPSRSRKQATTQRMSTSSPASRSHSSKLDLSISSASRLNHQPRVTLSAQQKKANHTNSEQRRRDLTGRAYQELFDLVPQLENMGKQSTMKKLEVVVARVAHLKGIVIGLRGKRDEMRSLWREQGYDWPDDEEDQEQEETDPQEAERFNDHDLQEEEE